MAITSLSSDLTLIPPSATAPLSAAVQNAPAFTQVQFRGKMYEVVLLDIDSNGNQSALNYHFDPATSQKVEELIKGLFAEHEKRSQTDPALTTPSLMNGQGMRYDTQALIDHNFDISNPAFSAKVQALSPSTPTPLKAQHAWNALDHILSDPLYTAPLNLSADLTLSNTPSLTLTPNQLTADLSVTNPTSPASPTSSPSPTPTRLGAPIAQPVQPNSNQPIMGIPVNPTQPPSTPQPTNPQTKPTSIVKPAGKTDPLLQDLSKDGVDLSDPHWFEKIRSPRLKRRLLLDVQNSNSSPLVQPLIKSLKTHDTHYLAYTESLLSTLETECASLPSTIDGSIRKQAEAIYNLNSRYFVTTKDKETAVQEAIDQLMQKDFVKKDALMHYLLAQARSEGLNVSLDWCKAHYREDVDRFVLALTRWLDTV